jgi:hypothetical protein
MDHPVEQLKDIKARMAQLGICTNAAVQQQLQLEKALRREQEQDVFSCQTQQDALEQEFFAARIRTRLNTPPPSTTLPNDTSSHHG